MIALLEFIHCITSWPMHSFAKTYCEATRHSDSIWLVIRSQYTLMLLKSEISLELTYYKSVYFWKTEACTFAKTY